MINKAELMGRVGQDPDIRTFQDGGRVANLSLATTRSWKNKTTGEKQEKTEWHNIAVHNKALVDVIEKHVGKGQRIHVTGSLETRSWEKDGQKRYMTEVVLRPYSGELVIIDFKDDSEPPEPTQAPVDPMEDDIPF